MTQSTKYYEKIFSSNPSMTIPENLKNKILELNDINALINSLKNNELEKIYNKLNKIFEETKDYIIDKYIYYIKTDPYIDLTLDNSIKTIVDKLIDNNREIFENEYYSIIDNNIKHSFIEKYNRTYNEETENILNYITDNTNMINLKLNSLNILKTDDLIFDIENKLNNTINAVNSYNLYFENVKISKDISYSLNNFCNDIVLPFYEEIKFILDNCTQDIVVNDLQGNIKAF